MASIARAFLISRLAELSLKPLQPHQPPPPFAHHLLIRPFLPAPASTSSRRRPSSFAAVNCLVSGVDGGGVSDDFVSTTKSGFGREFAVIANMLKRIEPLDTSVISEGVSAAAKDSMKQTISTMLGLLPSDQFSVTVRFSKHPLHRLIVSSIITGYTLWNAEYRISLMRNFEISSNSSKNLNSGDGNEDPCVKGEEVSIREIESGADGCNVASDTISSQNFEDLSPEALNYIQQLEMELKTVKQDLHALEQENLQMDYDKRSNNDLLDYLRLLEPDMVIELSKPSSFEVEEVIHQLAQNILRIFFKEETDSETEESMLFEAAATNRQTDAESCDTIGTSRDYLAKLLFWCMLLGHHLRGLENRLHLSCVVGLL
nr:Hop-interacting protein THI043 [Ipomoea batatas]GMC73469.1 Hop-interacting protein THI043 [Ipomoea batatas]